MHVAAVCMIPHVPETTVAVKLDYAVSRTTIMHMRRQVCESEHGKSYYQR